MFFNPNGLQLGLGPSDKVLGDDSRPSQILGSLVGASAIVEGLAGLRLEIELVHQNLASFAMMLPGLLDLLQKSPTFIFIELIRLKV